MGVGIGLKSGAVAARPDATRVANAMKRGLVEEKRVLDALGLEKNTKSMVGFDKKTGKMGKTIPDAVLPDGRTFDVKNVGDLRDSKQLRLQSHISEESGQKAQIITVGNKKVSATVEKRMDVQAFEDMIPEK